MSRTALRVVIVLGALSIAGIIFTQLYWVRRAFDLRENQFNHDVAAALRTVADRIFEINKTPSPANNPVDQVSTNYFVVSINGPVDQRLLKFLLKTEFEKRNITAGFDYCIYDCVDKCITNGSNLAVYPHTKVSDGYYFAVQFPGITSHLISQMGIWGFSSAVLLLVISFFAYTLFVILQQRRLSEIQRDFINNMTHEFKTPLSTIAISAAVLKDPLIIQQPERLLSYAAIIEQENTRLRQHVERVLQVASLDQKDIGLKKEPVDMHQLIAQAVRNIHLALQEKKGTIATSLQAIQFKTMADSLHLMNVLFNLLDNAIKYTPGAPAIQVTTSSAAGQLQIDITDNGPGISQENQKKVFDRFFRISTGNVHDVKGFGLGLNYVKLITEAHHGRITLSSAPGKGSTFTLILPVV